MFIVRLYIYISLSADNHLAPLRTAYSMYTIIDTTVYFYVDLIHVFCIAKYVKKMAYMYFNNSKMAKYTFVIKYYILFVFFVNSRFNCSSVNRDFVPANLEYSTNAISNVQTKIISSFIRKIWMREAQIDYLC